jgi:uncharacterized membrane protein
MAGKKFVRWLYGELPSLVQKGVLDDSHAAALKAHYGDVPKVGGRRVAIVIFSIIGSLLIGAGVIMLLAHNWSQLTRPARTFLAIAPLLAAQGFGVHVMRKQQGVAARESAATFISLLFASAVAVIGQTYHIGGDLGGFLLTCSIFIIPLAFLMDAVMPSVLYMGAITGWLGYERFHDDRVHLFWLLLVPVLLRYVKMIRKDPYAGRAVLLGWVMAICLPIATGFIQEYSMRGAWIVTFASVFSVMYLAAKRWFDDAESVWTSPFRAIGAAGIMVMSFLLTYDFFWDEAVRFSWWSSWKDFSGVDTLLLLIPAAGVATLMMPVFRKRRYVEFATGGMGLLTAFGFVCVVATEGEVLGMLLFNIYILGISISRIVSGLKRESVSALNSGMLMLGLLIMLRFLDSEFGFLAKGIVFILLGIGFLVVNLKVLRKKKEVSA